MFLVARIATAVAQFGLVIGQNGASVRSCQNRRTSDLFQSGIQHSCAAAAMRKSPPLGGKKPDGFNERCSRVATRL